MKVIRSHRLTGQKTGREEWIQFRRKRIINDLGDFRQIRGFFLEGRDINSTNTTKTHKNKSH